MISKFKEDGNENIRPNTITYSSVLDAHARQGDVNGANKVFKMMEEDYKSGNKKAKPNVQTRSILIDAWSKSENQGAPIEAESLLKEMIDLHIKGELDLGPDTSASFLLELLDRRLDGLLL